MMGRKDFQAKWFYNFSLEDRVPQDHLLRSVAKAVDFSFVRDLVRHTYSHTGTPSVDPVVVFKMALLGYLYGITSERRLADEIRLNLAYLWFLGYDLDETPPDHSILSKARSRYGVEAYRQFFNEIVRQCTEQGLVDGDRLYLDASLVRADASADSLVSRPLCSQLPSVDGYVRRLWADNEGRDGEGDDDPGPPPSRPPSGSEKRAKARSNERWVSRTDPEAAIISDRRRGLLLARKVHIAVDGGAPRVITGVVATAGDRPESHQVELLLAQHWWLTGTKPEELVADRGYGTTRVYDFLRNQRILPSIPRRAPWRHKAARGARQGVVRYRTHGYACGGCSFKPQCTRAKRCTINRPARMDTRLWVDAHLATARARRSLRRRRYWAETVIADLKGNHGLGRATLRGRAFEIQALLAATAHNIKQLAKTHPPKVTALRMSGHFVGSLLSLPRLAAAA
jgi:transposase